MPHLVKGGKYVFGWSKLGKESSLKIPDEAFIEYRFRESENMIIMNGSIKSGGFSVTNLSLVKGTVIGKIIEKNQDLYNFQIPEGEKLKIHNRIFGWTQLQKGNYIHLSEIIKRRFSLINVSKYLVVRGVV